MKNTRLHSLTDENANRLSETFADVNEVRAYIDAGIAELWEIDNGDSLAVIVFDKPGRIVWVLCYAGKNVIQFAEEMKTQCRKAGFRRIVFATHKPPMVRIMQRAGFKIFGTLCGVNI